MYSTQCYIIYIGSRAEKDVREWHPQLLEQVASLLTNKGDLASLFCIRKK